MSSAEKFTIPEIQKYYEETTAKLSEIDALLDTLSEEGKSLSDKEKAAKLDAITEKVKLHREEFYNVMEFLPGHDKLAYSKKYEEKLERVSQLKNELIPKKKFAFSSKNKTKENKGVKPQEAKSYPSKITNSFNETDLIIKDFLDQEKKFTAEEVKNKNNIIIENITNCTLYLLFNFKACYIKNINNCKIYIGSVSGGTHITNADDSFIYLITHQLRIHQSKQNHFFILINSNPIIEHCTRNVFSPLRIKYSNSDEILKLSGVDESKNKFDQVQDFQWLKQEKSPNFEVRIDNETVQI